MTATSHPAEGTVFVSSLPACTTAIAMLSLLPVALSAGLDAPPAAAGARHWLDPLFNAACALARQQPLVVIARREENRSLLAEAQVEARWGPQLNVNTTVDEDHRLSNSFVDGFGIVRDRTTTATAGLAESLDTGTSLTIQAGSSRADTTSAGAIYDTFYTSSVQLIVTQSLLQGGSREANIADLITARETLAGNREATLQSLEALLESLGEDWVNGAQRESEVALRQARRAASQHNLETAEERVKQGLDRKLSVLSLRRDLATQEAALGTAERALAGIKDRLAVTWPGLAVPPGADLAATPLTYEAPGVSYADTLSGHATLRRISLAARTLGVAQNNALDRLDLSVTLGKIGTDPAMDRAWADISNHQTYEWTVGLNYIHHFGSDVNRLEYTRATIALEQSKLQGDADERAWRTQDITLRIALKDAKATVEEQERVLSAYREEARLTHIQADNGLITVKDYLDIEQQVTDAAISVLQARLDVLRAELRLRAQEDRLLELLPK
jgi:outer membrane protein TolC